MTASGAPPETDGDPTWRPGGDEPTGLKDRVQRMASGYTRTQKIVAAVAVVGVVLGVLLVSKMTGGSDWAPLYTDLSPEDGNAIVSALEEEGVPHQLGSGGDERLVGRIAWVELATTKFLGGEAMEEGDGAEHVAVALDVDVFRIKHLTE